MIILYYSSNIHYLLFPKRNSQVKHIIKRYMFRTTAQAALNTSLIRPTIFNAVSCKYAGQYRARRWDSQLKSKESEHTRNDMNLSLHQASHVNIENIQTKKIVAIFTSSSGKKADPQAHFEKLDPVKYDGSYIPKIDAKTKQPIINTEGKTIPDPDKGGQYVAVLSYERQIKKDVEPLSIIDPTIQVYLDKHENKINTIINNSQQKKKASLTKIIGGKDDE